ncbi:hypothetical protein ABB37_00507 [Leptomonas pyrrhocoris]|uniref:Major facilitator superfamily (MFS) profile domain-containing protein n=1 Tax=Leptomonas pyrrhocoris TaxID=157538 RepID=A0A0M9GAI1_LEPPY|nr:hypothetical protein ABB37_00507 [Leptomonas pyrrhocoris]KPA86280.1 hypothetical protein ABB37_00507 [Leptomonas pyrrhocoris]|eukprot:XP_015664719.1 hypothetical protein ABB37_00507 [Leptomonas pyrrhocoris]
MGKSRAGKGSFYANMVVLSAVLVSESLSATLMMPFVGLFVSRLQHIPPSEAGYMSGLLISVFQLGQVLTGKMWGTASDRVGRKPMIQVGLLANAVVSIFFGMSPTLTFCVITRFIHGCANGNVLVAKTVIADITDKETEGMGFAAISIFWGVGSILGPAIGGYLYDPVHHAVLGPWLFPGVDENNESLFFDHPALLPCLVISVFSVMTLFVISWLLPETSRHPVDPFLSLFTPSSSLSVRGTSKVKLPGNAMESCRTVTAASDEIIAVAEENGDSDGGSDDDDDSAYDDGDDALGRGDGWRSRSGPSDGGRQFTKRLFSTTNALPSSESLNNVIASAMLAKEYDRRAAVSGMGAKKEAWTHVVAGRCTPQFATRSPTASFTSASHRRINEEGQLPRQQFYQQQQQQQQDTPSQIGDRRAAVVLRNAANVEDSPAAKSVDHSKLSVRSPPQLLHNKDIDSGDEPTCRRSVPITFGYREAFLMPSSRNVMVMYMCIASTESALLEVIPLWAISEREKGGLGFASEDIGTLLCISSLVYVAVNVVFSRILKGMGGATRPLWDLSVMLWCVTSILTPCCAYFTDEKTIFYSASVITSVREIGLSWSYSLLYMYVVRCAPDDCAGSINGIAQSIGSFSRMLTMLFIPPIFAWSLNGATHPFPFNFHFVFWVTCAPLLISFVASSLLPVRVTG